MIEHLFNQIKTYPLEIKISPSPVVRERDVERICVWNP